MEFMVAKNGLAKMKATMRIGRDLAGSSGFMMFLQKMSPALRSSPQRPFEPRKAMISVSKMIEFLCLADL